MLLLELAPEKESDQHLNAYRPGGGGSGSQVRKSHCHVFLGGLDPGQAPLKTLLLMLRLT